MGQRWLLLRILIRIKFTSPQISNKILFHRPWHIFRMVSATFLVIKGSYTYTNFSLPLFFPVLTFLFFSTCLLSAAIFFLWLFDSPLGQLLLMVKENTRSLNWHFIFPSLYVLYILCCFLNYFYVFWHVWNLCTFFAQLHINDHLFVQLYCTLLFLRINKVFWGGNLNNTNIGKIVHCNATQKTQVQD